MNDQEFTLTQVAIRMVKERTYYSQETISSPEDAVRILSEELSDYDREVAAVVNLSTSGKPINVNIASIGSINRTIISPRELLKTSILSNASAVIILHNHPSGDPTPSAEDLVITEKLKQIYTMMDISLHDHIIIGDSGRCFSVMTNTYFHKDECNKNRSDDIEKMRR